MTVMQAPAYRRAEYHGFAAGGSAFVYLVSAGAIFEVDADVRAVLDRLEGQELTHADMIRALTSEGRDAAEAEALVRELRAARLIQLGAAAPVMPQAPPADFPLQALVLNVTNQCNLACTYCYEFGADKIATPAGKPKYMTLETAKASVDLLIAEAVGRKAVHITFFGGETLMNFRLLRDVVEYANAATAAAGKGITYSLTTNATLLTEEIVTFLSDNRIGVT
ncbi:MAG: radical SAM protein, partial [Sphingobium sp.]